jgi:hypothetical protein
MLAGSFPQALGLSPACRRLALLSLLAAGLLYPVLSVTAGEPDAKGAAFFEKRVRPVLVEHCYACHSAEAKKLRAGLRLDTRDGIRKGGDSGPAVVPGNATESLLIQAVRHEFAAMPPKGKLSDAVIADLVRWVEMGAPDPRGGGLTPRRAAFQITAEDRRHWAFQPVGDPRSPQVRGESWCRSEVDPFILAALEKKGLRPSPPADRYTLLRRATFDLTGLPPTPADVEAFQADPSPLAFARVIERLLASPAFGERWGRHWLDGVRYASDVDKSGAYRDWVVRALNEDLPYDRFVQLQIAGDLIPADETDPARVHTSGASLEGVKATGMLALAVWEKVARDLAVAEIVDSQIDVVGRQFLGLTLACARCHDHKFDPISTEDYYGLAGVFFSSHISSGKLIADGRLADEVIGIPLLSKADTEKNRHIDEAVARLGKEIAVLEQAAGPAAQLMTVRARLQDLAVQLAKASGAAKQKLATEIQRHRADEKKLLEDKAHQAWPDNPRALAQIVRLRGQVAALEKSKVTPPLAIGIREGGVPGSNRERIGDAPVYLRGDYRKEGPVVSRRFPVILAQGSQVPVGQVTRGSGRLELARWITSPENPLTARVVVNRVWQHLLEEGLVRTPDNFGRLGEPPTHPELLDYLARRFVAQGWSVKRLIREIMLSNTYQQASFADPALVTVDPENRWRGRMSRKRLEYEALRDSLLYVSGQLALSGGTDGVRRTLYEPLERVRLNPARAMFDGPDPLGVVPVRAATTTTPQALFLMNSPLVREAAQRLAGQIQEDLALRDEPARIRHAYLRLLGRPPSPAEVRIGRAYLARAPWANYLQVLFCTNEFLYLD